MACQNATAVFLNVSPSSRGDGAESRQATNVVRAARASGTVTTLVYSNVYAVGQRKEFPRWHDDTMSGIRKDISRARVLSRISCARQVSQTGQSSLPAVFMTNYLPPSVRGYFSELAEFYTLRTAMVPEKRTMLLRPDDIGRFAAALVELERFSQRAI